MSALHEAWFQKADNDLNAVRLLLASEAPLLDVICFHCQQATEKYLKGYLIWKGVDFYKRHDLNYLIDLCAKEDGSFSELNNVAETMNGYEVEFRYPDEDTGKSLDSDQVKKALSQAERVAEFVRAKIGGAQ